MNIMDHLSAKKIDLLTRVAQAYTQTYFMLSINPMMRGPAWLGTKWGDLRHREQVVKFVLGGYRTSLPWAKETEEQKEFVAKVAEDWWNYLIKEAGLHDKEIGKHTI